jgi:type IV secretion system protein TrbG
MRYTLIVACAVSVSVVGFSPELLQAQQQSAEVAAATREYQSTGRARTLRTGSSIVFPYGHSQPTIICAPLRACVIELDRNEILLDQILSDPERWDADEARGPGGGSLVVVKPVSCDLTTNLVLTTDQRIYHMTLDSPSCGQALEQSFNPDLAYTRHVRFYYPDDMVRRIASEEAVAAAQARQEEQSVIPVQTTNADPTEWNFAYRWQRDRRFPWVPTQVFDDGAQTFIRLPESARNEELPVLFSLDPSGSMQIVNYAKRGDYFVADRVLRRAVLVTARRGSEQRLLIINLER